jgi:hypothetical protein
MSIQVLKEVQIDNIILPLFGEITRQEKAKQGKSMAKVQQKPATLKIYGAKAVSGAAQTLPSYLYTR